MKVRFPAAMKLFAAVAAEKLATVLGACSSNSMMVTGPRLVMSCITGALSCLNSSVFITVLIRETGPRMSNPDQVSAR